MQFFVVNAFTSSPFKGNPATVCVVPNALVEESIRPFYRAIANEVSAVETAFVLPAREPNTDYHIRFFTKVKETPFCGHAALAAAHILATEYSFASNLIRFSTELHGILTIRRKQGGGGKKEDDVDIKCQNQQQFELDLKPILPVELKRTTTERNALAGALGLSPASFRHVAIHPSSANLIVSLRSASDVISAAPDLRRLMETLTGLGVVKVTLTAIPMKVTTAAAGGPTTVDGGGPNLNEAEEAKWRGFDFITRLFAPWIGINEDAVSGASHAILAKHWAALDTDIAAKATLRCFQPSPRTGEVCMHILEDHVRVSGAAVTITKGTLIVPSSISANIAPTSLQSSKL